MIERRREGGRRRKRGTEEERERGRERGREREGEGRGREGRREREREGGFRRGVQTAHPLVIYMSMFKHFAADLLKN